MSKKRKPESIKRLEKEIGYKLRKRWFGEVGGYRNQGFTLDGEGNVIGLNLDGMGLKKLPESLPGFVHLQKLHLYNNQLEDVNSLQRLMQLTTLNLVSNQLTDVSPLKGLTQLKELRLHNNQLTDVSPLKGLTMLTILDLSRNQLTELPKELIRMDMEIEEVSEIGVHLGLHGLYIADNPIEFPPMEILKHGRDVTLSYLASLKVGRQLLNEVKVLFVGDGGSGKTSLMKQFLDRDFDPSEPQTHGINIEKCMMDHANHDSPVTLNLWDFGGQQIMHATHLFFLSHRSIYILLLDGRKNEEFEYWFKHIESFGGDSPVLVVINKVDQQHHFDLNRKFLMEKYKSIAGFHRISCKNGTGVAELKTALHDTLNRVKIIRTVWPTPWFKVKQRLEQTARHYIAYEEYESICIEENISEAHVRNVLLDYLNDIGVNLHFKELELHDTHVLEPRWVTEAVYKIINAPILAQHNGELRLDELPGILERKREGDLEYPRDKHCYIIALMKKFELCYSLDDDDHGARILVPDLLPKEEPEFELSGTGELEFIIQYDFLPRSVMPRFIVQMHRDIKVGLQWRTGVVLEDRGFGCEAVVRADNRDRKISIRVRGEQRRYYLAALMSRLRGINQGFEKLKTEERVPMPDNKELTANYKQLIRFEQKGIDVYLPPDTEKEYPVKELLGSISETETTQEKILELVELLVERLVEEGEKKESAVKKLNNAFSFKPKLLGVEIDVNHIFDVILDRKKKKKSKE